MMIIHIKPDVVEIRAPTYYIRTQLVRKHHMAIMGEDQDMIYDLPPEWPEDFPYEDIPLYWERGGVSAQMLEGFVLLTAFYFEHAGTGMSLFKYPALLESPDYEETGGVNASIELNT